MKTARKPKAGRVRRPGKPDPDAVQMSIAVHREIRNALGAAARLEDIRMPERLHIALCRDLNRPDLLDWVPPSNVYDRARA